MGEVIRKNAAREDILADVTATLTRARAAGGQLAADAEARLGNVLTLASRSTEQRIAAERELAPLEATVDTQNRSADLLLARVADEVWNAVGRPGHDVVLDVLFPGGIAYYADGDVATQPMRMNFLAELLEAGLHPKLSIELARDKAGELRRSAAALDTAVQAVLPLRARHDLAEQTEGALARYAQTALVALKRQWKANGESEAAIHQIIPDRPTAKPEKTEKPAT